MEYKNFLEDFITRSKKNLKEYHGVDEVTQLINSLLGLVTIPESWEYSNLDNIIVDFKQFIIKEENKNISNMKFKDFIRHFRNGIAHGYIYTFSDSYGQIDTIFIADYNPSKHKGKYLDMKVREVEEILEDFDYVFKFSVKKLDDFVTEFSEQILKMLGIKDDGED